jgi:hypothetical protein
MKNIMPARSRRFFRLVLLVLMTAALEQYPPKLQAEEGGAGDYIPGLSASLINITPNKPGFALGTGYLFYAGSVSTGATLPFGGILASNISADVSLADLSLTYTFCLGRARTMSSFSGEPSSLTRPTLARR